MEHAFETDLRMWIDFDNQLRTYRRRTESLRRSKQETELAVLGHVRRMNLGRARINLPDGHLTFGVHTCKTPISLRLLGTALEAANVDNASISRIYQALDEVRGAKKIPVVRRVIQTENEPCTVDNDDV